MMNLKTLLQKAHWLNKREKKGILEAFAALDSNGLSMDEKSKLFRLVCSIPYAEMGVTSHGKLYIVIIEKCLQWLGIRFLFRRSV